MESKDKSVFDRLEDIEAKQERFNNQNEQIIELLQTLNEKKDRINEKSSISPKENSQQAIRNFIKRSKKEYIWFGPSEDFVKEKKRIYLFGWILVLLSIMASVFTALSCGFFSIASIFELWWMILVIVIMMHHTKMKKRMIDIDLMDASSNNFIIDEDGILRNTMCESKFYKISRILSYIASAVNILALFAYINQPWMVGIAVALETSYIVIAIILRFFQSDFDGMYETYLIITGMNDSKTEEVKLVVDLILQKLITYEEFKKLFPKDFIQ